MGVPEHRPASHARRSLLPPVVALFLAAVLALGVFVYLRGRDRQDARMTFEKTARIHIRAIERALSERLTFLESVAAFCASSWPLDQEGYAEFAAPMLAKQPGMALAAVGAPAGMTGEGAASYPLALAVGAGASEARGYDLAAIPELARAVELALRQGDIFVLPAPPLGERFEEGAHVVVFVPIYAPGNMLRDEDSRREAALGVVAGLMHVGDVMEEAVGTIRQQGVDIHCFDLFGPLSGRLLGFRPSPDSAAPLDPLHIHEARMHEGPCFRQAVHVGKRRWLFFCAPSEAYWASLLTWRPAGAGALAMVFGLMLALYLWHHAARTRSIEALVGRRTAELREANRQLQVEIAERKRFEEERDGLLILQEKANASLRSLNERLASSNRDLEDFAFVASHDLKEPLRKIQVFCDRLGERLKQAPDPRAEEYVELIQDGVGRMRRLMDDLLQVSRVRTHGQAFEMVDLARVVEQVVEDLSVQIEDTGAAVEVGGLDVLWGDATQLRQLFQNLLSNSLKYHKPGEAPRIKVEGKVIAPPREDGGTPVERAGLYQISVRDHGIGIAPQDAERAFALFQRLNTNGQYEGSGVGLTVCRKIAERHGGAISLRSTPGDGVTFFVTLPMRDAGGAGEDELPAGEEDEARDHSRAAC